MTVNVLEIIRNSSLKIKFQPILSVATQQLVGLEALSRGYVNETIIPPDLLFEQAREQGLIRELDYKCHFLAIKEFAKYRNAFSSPILFMNFDSSYVCSCDVEKLLEQLKQFDVNPEDVVIEINEIENIDFTSIKCFADNCRRYGFIVSLDDIGSGFSNLDRLADIQPHIIKTDKELAKNIQSSYHKQEIIKSLIDLSHKTGSVPIIEGVETLEDFLLLVSMDAKFIQGFYFDCPQYINDLDAPALAKKLKYALRKKAESSALSASNKQFLSERIPWLSNQFSDMNISQIPEFLNNSIRLFSEIECVYLLNISGIQLSETIFSNDTSIQRNRLSHLYHPASVGTDHSLKKYYTALLPPVVNCSITDRYISLATGMPCITISSLMRDSSNTSFILCIDLFCD